MEVPACNIDRVAENTARVALELARAVQSTFLASTAAHKQRSDWDCEYQVVPQDVACQHAAATPAQQWRFVQPQREQLQTAW
jgi:hypothetical protein